MIVVVVLVYLYVSVCQLLLLTPRICSKRPTSAESPSAALEYGTTARSSLVGNMHSFIYRKYGSHAIVQPRDPQAGPAFLSAAAATVAARHVPSWHRSDPATRPPAGSAGGTAENITVSYHLVRQMEPMHGRA